MPKRKLKDCRQTFVSIGCVCDENAGWLVLCNLAGIKETDVGIARKKVRAMESQIRAFKAAEKKL